MSDPKLRPELGDPTEPRGESGSSTDGAAGWSLSAWVRRWLAREPGGPGDELSSRYRIEGVLGRGGMGEVVLARDRRLRRDVALKTARLDTSERDGVGRFLHEAQVTAQLAHPNIPPLHDLGTGPDGTVFFTMRALPGRPLSQLLKEEGPQPVGRALEWFGKVCDAVGYAHAQGVLHRDLKPGNILVGSHGEVYVIDWGLARRIREDAPVRTDADDSGDVFTEVGAVIGTPGYMSPEQLAGDVPLDARADVYALGAVLYALLAGRPPFLGQDPALRLKVHRGEYPPLRRVCASAPWALDRVVHRAMAARREERYPSVEALQADLHAFLEGRPLPGIRYPAWRRAGGVAGRWWRPLLGAAAVGGALATLALAAVGYHAWSVTRARDRALQAEREVRLRSLDQDVVLAQLVARLGLQREARAALLDAAARGASLGADPRRSAFALAALDAAYPPPDVWIDPRGPAVAAAFDADRAALGVTDGTSTVVSVVDLTTGARLHRHALAPGARLLALRFDGPRAGLGAWVLDGRRLQRVDVATGEVSPTVELPGTEAVVDAVLSADGARVAIGDGVRTRFFTVPGGAPVGPARAGVVDHLSADGTRAVAHAPVGGPHRQVTRFEAWDVDGGAVLGPLPDLEAAFSEDLGTALSVVEGGVRVRRGERADLWTGTPRQPSIVTDGDLAVLFGVDGRVEERALATGAVVRRRGVGMGREPGASQAYVAPGWLAAPVGGAWHLWSRVDLAPPAAVPGGSPLALALSPDGVLAAGTSWSGAVTVWEWRTGRALLQVSVSPDGVRDAAFSADGGRLATADREGAVRVLDLRTAALGPAMDAGHGIATGVWWEGEGTLWASYEDGTLLAWDPVEGRAGRGLHGEVASVWRLRAAGGTAAVSGRSDTDPVGELWDLSSGAVLRTTAAVNPGYAAAVSPDGRTAAFGTSAGSVVLLDGAGERELPLDGGGAVMALAFSPSGTELVAGTFSGRLLILDPRTGDLLLDLEGYDDGVADVVFVPGTRTLLGLGGSRGTLTALDLDGSRAYEETALRVAVGSEAETPWTTALHRAELRRDWAHAAQALARGRAAGERTTAARAARVAQETGDLGEAIRLLRTGPDGAVSDATREIWAAALERQRARPPGGE